VHSIHFNQPESQTILLTEADWDELIYTRLTRGTHQWLFAGNDLFNFTIITIIGVSLKGTIIRWRGIHQTKIKGGKDYD
jgi:hypothetical protein